MKITNGQEASHYYNIVNSAIDNKYMKAKVDPIRLQMYLKKGTDSYKRFLAENNLNECDDIDTIIKHVLDDRANIIRDMKKEGIMLFEEFNTNIDITYEKILADFYSTSLGFITPTGVNSFIVDDFGTEVKVLVYSIDDLKKLKHDYGKEMFDEYIATKTIIHNVLSVEINAEDIVDHQKLHALILNNLNKRAVIELISKKTGYTYMTHTHNKEYYIWEKEG